MYLQMCEVKIRRNLAKNAIVKGWKINFWIVAASFIGMGTVAMSNFLKPNHKSHIKVI